jgi:glycolate oxidase FAD binding subunit
LSVKSTAPYADLGGAQAIEWGGAVRWLRADGAQTVRAWAREHGGHATLYRGDKSSGAFEPLDAPMLAIHRALKANFDPAGIFNRHRMYREF